jgi:hypothetical protein
MFTLNLQSMKVPFMLALALLAMRVQAAPPAGAPASVTKEADLVVITLTSDAVKRLRLKVVPVEKRVLPATRLFSGEVVIPLGAEDTAVAPVLGGTLAEILQLASAQTTADGQIRQAQVKVEAAKIALERAQTVRKAEAGSQRSVDEAKVALALTEVALDTAAQQRALLGSAVHQQAASQRTWVRVAIYSGEAGVLDAKAIANIRTLASETPSLQAKPISGPATANSATHTVDWYYELSSNNTLRAGERVTVEIPTHASTVESLVVPFSAVLHDIHGGQWVYEQTKDYIYTRRRVQVARLAGSDAALTSGPPVGSKIVTDGAAELFGTEFMTGK